MTAAHNYLALHEEMLGVRDHYLALAAQLPSQDSITANRIRLMAELADKILQSTEIRMWHLATPSGEGEA